MPDGRTVPPGGEPLLEVRALRKYFPLRQPLLAHVQRREPLVLKAVDDVDLTVARGEVLGLVGETGCGKSTLARCIAGLYEPTAGEIRLDGQALAAKRRRAVRRRIQMVFQDPYSSLNPRMTVSQAVGEILRVHHKLPRDQVAEKVNEPLNLVDFPTGLKNAYPRSLSGGLRQRVSIARALAADPEILLADEPVSALDVSVQATILNLLADLRARLGLTLLLITHDMAVVGTSPTAWRSCTSAGSSRPRPPRNSSPTRAIRIPSPCSAPCRVSSRGARCIVRRWRATRRAPSGCPAAVATIRAVRSPRSCAGARSPRSTWDRGIPSTRPPAILPIKWMSWPARRRASVETRRKRSAHGD
jgi:ABC-type oligopeptide transport system ATPase subunit